ncbi:MULTISPECIES: stress response membrane protein YncL [unclassified Leclercia]|jgi:hypothetical protein|nr:stress response membrane protein YncL [Leclercia sp.]
MSLTLKFKQLLAIPGGWAILEQVLQHAMGHIMNVSSRTVVILNILSATALLVILADKFHWF